MQRSKKRLLMLLIAVVIRLDSPGPVVFRQPRVGRSDRVFNMWKFRTMRHGADEEVKSNHLRELARVQGTGEAGSR